MTNGEASFTNVHIKYVGYSQNDIETLQTGSIYVNILFVIRVTLKKESGRFTLNKMATFAFVFRNKNFFIHSYYEKAYL